MGDADRSMPVSVLYALPEQQLVVSLSLYKGATAGDAVKLSGLIERFPGMGERPCLARFGKSISWNTELEAHDRIDILRPLSADPKEFRRRRAELQRRSVLKP